GVSDFDAGKHLAGKILTTTRQPTAVFVANDIMAFGVIHELTTQGIRVPEDLSIIGFDGIDYGMMIHPPLTTIKQPDYEMGKLACGLLFDKMNGRESVEDVTLQPELLIRS